MSETVTATERRMSFLRFCRKGRATDHTGGLRVADDPQTSLGLGP